LGKRSSQFQGYYFFRWDSSSIKPGQAA
jgi:hypothetical protein